MHFNKRNIILFLIFFLLQANSVLAANFDIDEIRMKFAKAIESETITRALFTQLKDVNAADNPLVLAYKGGTEALIARHSWNPYSKLYYLKRSQQTLQMAIRMAPENAEIRFLRFSIQHYIPQFLGISANIEEDKKAIIANINGTNGAVKKAIIKFLLDCGRCSEPEKKMLSEAV